MNDVALANRSDVGIVALREPAGERQLPAPAGIGGAGARVIVPQAADGEQLRLLFDGSHWSAEPVERGVARLNGEPLPLTGAELRAGDVLALGAAQIVVTELEGSRAQIEVRHLAGNDTVAPLQAPPARGEFDDEADVDVVAPDNLARIETWRGRAARGARRARQRATLWAAGATIAVALAAVFGLLGRLQRVALDVQPRDAQVESVGRWFSWHSGATLLVLPGRHQLRVTRAGYAPVTQQIEVDGRPRAPLRLRLEKLPGRIAIDTGGIPAEVYADGAPVGRAPGIVQVPAGRRTITVRAERYVDAVQSLEVEGADVLQNLQFKLQSSWGKLEVRSATPGAQVAANDGALQTVPAILDLPAGVHRVRLVAPQAKPWESTVIVKAGDITRLGPITLGAPDAELRVRSDPSGADVTVGGVFKGRTPLTVPLPAGASYEILVVRPGYRPWSRSVAAAAGARLDLTPRLEPIWVSLAVSGEPADAELLVDGQPRGRTPQTLQLTATVHAIEVRKPGSEPFKAQIDLGSGLARTLEYRLVPAGRPANWQPPSEFATAKAAGQLRLVMPGTFTMGSPRREQGRRPNESYRPVTLTRPFYIGVREVTNGEFRRFRAEHKSGFFGQQSLDLDNQPVSSVSYDDAAQYCNWLSQQEGLPPAYESRDGRMVLKTPVGPGYRLPTEAEWEYAARWTPQGQRRFGWGDALPVPSGYANLAGAETAGVLGSALENYRDEHGAAAPVGRYPPNPLGLYDMTGNVSEWVNDRYSSFVDNSAVTDPLGPDSGKAHVVRGSSWRTANVGALRLAWRDAAEAGRDDLGFRIARYVE